MTHHAHAIVWIDHRVAKIFEFNWEDADKKIVRHWHAAKQIHHKAGAIGSGHVPEENAYLHEVGDALSEPAEILIVGPSHVKWQLRAYLNLHAPRTSQRVMAVLHADHPSDRQIIDYGRKYFSRVDRMTPQRLTQSL